MAATSTLTLRVKSIGERSIDAISRKLLKLSAITAAYSSISQRSLQSTDVKWKKHFDGVDKAIKAFGGAVTKFVTMSAKFAVVQVGALGLAMMAVHASFVLGNAAMKAFRFLATGAAGAAASLTIAASIAAAAVREQQIAMYSYKGGDNYQNASVAMRALAADADLATVGAANLNAVFGEVSKTSTFTAGSQNLLKGLMDFASAGKPLEEGAKSAGKLIAAIQNPKASFSKMKEAAKELGPEMEKAIKDLGITSSDELKKAILDGTLSAAGGVDGQFSRVNDTLVNRFKTSFALIKNSFADFGEPLLGPTKKMFEGIVKTFNQMFRRIAGDIAAFAQGGMFDDAEGAVTKMADFFVNFIRDYLPKVQGMFSSLGSWWDRFKEGWNMILGKLRPLIDGARIFEETMMKVLRPIGNSLSEGFGSFNQQLIDNKEEFYEFGNAIGRFIAVMSKYAKTVRDIFVDALPFLTKIIEGLTGIVDLFMSLLGGFRGLLGGGGMGSFMLLATMLSGGRAMKKTTGGYVASYKMKDVTPSAGSGPLTGQTAKGNVTEGGKARAGALARAGGTVAQQRVMQMSVQSMTVMSQMDKATASQKALDQKTKRDSNRSTRDAKIAEAKAKNTTQQQVMAKSRLDEAKANAKDKTGMAGYRANREVRRASKAAMVANQGTVRLPQLGMADQVRKNNWFTRNFRMTAEQNAQMKQDHLARTGATPGVGVKTRAAMQNFRQMRESTGYRRMFGGDIGTKDAPRVVKGINNTMGASLGASVALGVASKLAPESAQGALALGSMVSMVNPLAGLAVGVVGGLVMGIRGAAAAKKKEAQGAARSFANDFANDTMNAFQDGIKNAIETGTFDATTVGKQKAIVTKKFADKENELLTFFESGGNAILNERGRASLAAGSGNEVYGNFETGVGGWASSLARDFFDGAATTLSLGLIDGRDLPGRMGSKNGERVTGASSMEELMRLDANGADRFDADKIEALMKKQRTLGTGIFGTMEQGQYDSIMEDPEAGAAMLVKQMDLNMTASEMLMDLDDERMTNLVKGTNKSEEAVRKLSDEIGLNLMDSTMQVTEQLKILGEAMINTKREMDIAAQDRYAAGTAVYDRELKSIDAKLGIDESAFALRQQFNEGGLEGDAGTKKLLEFMQTTRDQYVAYYKGDVQLAESVMMEAYGRDGYLYNIPGGVLEGMGGIIMDKIGGTMDTVNAEAALGRETALTEFITAKGLQASQVVTEDSDLAGLVKAMAGDQDTYALLQTFLDTVDLTSEAGQNELATFLSNAGYGEFDLKFEKFVEPQMAAATALQKAGEDLQSAAAAIGTALGGPDPADTPDTRTPRGAIGDTTSRSLGNTLSNHSAVSGSIPGKRNITSGYRNYALGSLKSDHVTGRALDIVGDNLVSYRDTMTSAGGFAEFHGKGDTRHLHVVPPSRRLGDSPTVGAVTSSDTEATGGRVITNSNNFYITGANPQEIANAVMAKMAVVNKSNGERK